MKIRISTILFAIVAFVCFSGSASVVNFGDGKYLLKISEETPIEKGELESMWLKQAKSICRNREFTYAFDDAKTDESRILVFDRETKRSHEKTFPLGVELGGAFKCN